MISLMLGAGFTWSALSQPDIEGMRKRPATIDQKLSDAPAGPIQRVAWRDNVADGDLVETYERIRSALKAIYLRSGVPSASVYQSWRRYNRSPYMSPAEGLSFRNNYANALGGAYGTARGSRKFPVGSILAKDSFIVTESGRLYPGPLSLMEKMPAGFNEVTADWRFTQVEPDGSILGTTNGENADKMLFCMGCHFLAGADRDYVFSVPENARVLATR